MEKLTLSIQDKEKIEWAKAFAKAHDTSISQLFESYLESLKAFDQKSVSLSDSLLKLKQPGKRPGKKQIEYHLMKRRHRSSQKK